MLGLMQNWPLTVDRILDHANNAFPNREVVTRSVEGPLRRTTYAHIRNRAKQVTNALRERSIAVGDRVANSGLEHRASYRGVVWRDEHGRRASHGESAPIS